MYYWKSNKEETKELLKGKTEKQLAEEIGTTPECVSYILTKKRHCKKTLAYIITKMIDSEKEIDDFFNRKEVE